VDVGDRFEELVKTFGERIEQSLEVKGGTSAVFRFGEQEDLGHLQYLPQSENIVIWATVGFLPPDGLAPMRAVRILQFLDLVPEIHGFTLGAEPGTGRLVASARRTREELEDVAVLVTLVDELAEVVRTVRTELADALPVEFEDFDAAEVDLGDEGEDSLETAEEA